MVKRNLTDIAREIDNPIPDHSSQRQSSTINSKPADDIIVWLTNAYENKRARQVTEWERAQPAYLRHGV